MTFSQISGSSALNLARFFSSVQIRQTQVTFTNATPTTDAPAPTTTTPPTTPTTPTAPTSPTTPSTSTPPTSTPTTPNSNSCCAPRESDCCDISPEARERSRAERSDNCERGEGKKIGHDPERLLRLADKFAARAERLEARAQSLLDNDDPSDDKRAERLMRRADRSWTLAEKFANMVPGNQEEQTEPSPTTPTNPTTPTSAPVPTNSNTAPAPTPTDPTAPTAPTAGPTNPTAGTPTNSALDLVA
jgi:hypothetical protein